MPFPVPRVLAQHLSVGGVDGLAFTGGIGENDAGMRGAKIGGAQMSPMHSNFLINAGGATAADLEDLGEEVRKRVFQHSGITLEWEIMRVGVRSA